MADEYHYSARGFLTVSSILEAVGMSWRGAPEKLKDRIDIAVDRTSLRSTTKLPNEAARHILLYKVIEEVFPEYAPLLIAIKDAVAGSEKPSQT